MPRGAFRQGTGASCLGLRQAATAAAIVWIAELAVMPRPGAWRAVPTARWCRCGVGQDGAILSLLRRQAARRGGLAPWLPTPASGAVRDSNAAAILFATLRQGEQAGSRQPLSQPQCRHCLRGDATPVLARWSSSVASAIMR